MHTVAAVPMAGVWFRWQGGVSSLDNTWENTAFIVFISIHFEYYYYYYYYGLLIGVG